MLTIRSPIWEKRTQQHKINAFTEKKTKKHYGVNINICVVLLFVGGCEAVSTAICKSMLNAMQKHNYVLVQLTNFIMLSSHFSFWLKM